MSSFDQKTRIAGFPFSIGSTACFSLLLVLILYSNFVTSSESSYLSRVLPSEYLELGGVDDVVNLRRSVAEASNQSSLILAEQRTYRKDPIDGFKRYGGGWNISNKHYWASVGFTAAPAFAIAAIWFVLFGLMLFLSCLCYCCCRPEPYGYSRLAYALSLIFLILFTISAIVGCVVLYTGQGKFHGSTTATLRYVVSQADTTVENLRNVSGYLSAAKRIGVDQVTLPVDVQSRIDNILNKINSSGHTLSDRTKKNSRDIKKILNAVRTALVIIAAVMLFLAFLGFSLSILGKGSIVNLLVVVGWILVAGTFILCGVFVLLHNVVADTCVAMDEWVLNPTAYTALDDILPCVDNATAQETLLRSKEVTFQLVNVVDTIISTVSNTNMPPGTGGPLSFNQSGPLMPLLCNPFTPNFSDRVCQPGEVELNNAKQIWSSYICEVTRSGMCRTVGRVTPSIFDQMVAATDLGYGLYHYGSFLVELEDCTFVRKTFSDISNGYCPGLRKYSRWVYIGLAMVSTAVMLSLIFWVVYARERRHRAYTKMAQNPPF